MDQWNDVNKLSPVWLVGSSSLGNDPRVVIRVAYDMDETKASATYRVVTRV